MMLVKRSTKGASTPTCGESLCTCNTMEKINSGLLAGKCDEFGAPNDDPSCGHRWLVDSRSGQDLISEADLLKRKVSQHYVFRPPIHLIIANGRTTSTLARYCH